jgi:hypothetical protein
MDRKTASIISGIIIVLVLLAGLWFLSSQTSTQTPINTGTLPTYQNPFSGKPNPAQNTPTPAVAKSPADLTKGFYSWYIGGLISDQSFVTSDEFKSHQTNWLTPRMIAEWQFTDVDGADPALQAQDFQDSWASDIQTSVQMQSATSTVVALTLGAENPLNIQHLLVTVVPVNGNWLIDSVTLPQ